MKKIDKDNYTAKVDYLPVTPRELVSVSRLNQNPTAFINKVNDTDRRLIVTKNGRLVAGIVPMWMLAAFEDVAIIRTTNTHTECSPEPSKFVGELNEE